MKKLTEQDGKSLDMVNKNLEVLKAIFPEAFTEDGVDFEVLRELLGDAVAEGEEKYGLTWHGKKKARQIALMPSLGTLRPCKEESVDWDTTQNLFIEGDNLEVLKLLQKSYANKVKMIYIDPPYNTGKEFIYPDKFQDNLDTYLRYTGLRSEEGKTISSEIKSSKNTIDSGRYHTNWINMMLPRLKLSRNLLRADGAIFISIDDNEVSNVRKLCDEIFGEENFIASISVQSNPRGRQSDTFVASVHDYLIVYAKNIVDARVNGMPLTEKQKSEFSLTEVETGEKYRLLGLRQRGSASRREDRLDMYFPIFVNPNTLEISLEFTAGWEVVYPKKSDGSDGRWMWGKERCSRDKHFLVARLIKRRDEHDIFVKDYLNRSDGERTRKYKSVWDEKGYNNQAGTQEVKALFQGDVMSFPKSKHLLCDICRMGMSNNEIVLDFFAGSATTAHAVFELNVEDGAKRNFIMVQLPELCDEKSGAFKAGYETIAEIGKERIRRAAAKIKEENPDYDGDLGFKVFKLDSSNIRVWSPDRNDLEQTIIDHMEHLVAGRSEEDVLYELLLKRGVDLTVPIEEKTIAGKTVYSIGYGVLFACLDISISRGEVEDLAMGIIGWHKILEPASDTQVVFRDSAFDGDIAKTNMTAILEQNGIKHVRSL